MAITRNNARKDVMVILDYPLVHEQSSGKAYSESSSTELKDKISSAAIMESKGKEHRLFLSSEEVCYTYLSTERPDSTDSDWKSSIVCKRSIPEDETYYQIDYLKDVWVSRKIMVQLQALLEQIKQVQPKLVILGGKWSLFFLATLYAEPETQLATIAGTKNTPKKMQYFGGLNKYRASLLTFHSALGLPDTVVLPILTPAYQWIIKDKIEIINKDYAKVAQINRFLQSGYTPTEILTPRRTNRVGLTKDECVNYLKELVEVLDTKPTMVVFDVETRHKGIDCEGICYKASESFTIPFTEMYPSVLEQDSEVWYVTKYKEEAGYALAGTPVTRYRHYWSIEDEVEIMYWLGRVKLHPNCQHVGQNYLYDAQFYLKQWKMRVNAKYDTMVLHHVLYNYLQKDLGLLASMYCWDAVAWKSEISSKENIVRWKYNGKDVCYNYTVAEVLLAQLEREPVKLQEFYKFQQEEVCRVVVTMMDRGCAIDNDFKEDMRRQFTEIYQGCIDKLNWVFGEEINLNSTPQVKAAFKDMLGIVPIKDRKTKAESFGAEAMLVYLDRYPEYRSLLTLFLESKSIKVFLRTFLNATVSDDGRMRCSYNPAGTKTYRFSSRKAIDGTGTNLANLPSKGKIDLRYSLQDIPDTDDSIEIEDDYNAERLGKIVLPNCKRMFIPDKDMIIADADYSSIDLHFVIYEADCKFLKQILKSGKDVYSVLASHYYQREITKDMDERQIFKAICHGCVTGEHEVLTQSGWLAIEDLEDGIDIAVWNKDTKEIYFEIPKGINRDFVEDWEDLVLLESSQFSQLVTCDHKLIYNTSDVNPTIIAEAHNVPKSARLPLTGQYINTNGKVESDAFMRLMVAFQADGSVSYVAKNGDITYRFQFRKERKILRIKEILNELGIEFVEYIGARSTGEITTQIDFKNILSPEHKYITWDILQYSETCLRVWLDELKFWDGSVNKVNGQIAISTSIREEAEIIATVAHLLGTSATIFIGSKADSTRNANYKVTLNQRNLTTLRAGKKEFVKHNGTKVYCPQTSTGFFMVRRKGHIMVTGNTNYLGRAPALAAKAGLAVSRVKQVQDWYFSQCPEIFNWHNKIKNDCITKRYTENIFGARFWCMNPNDRDDGMWLNKMVASVPQSSAAILVNKAIVNLENTENGKIQTLLQVHDSLVVQYHKDDITAPERILKYMAVEIPYEDVLVIPADLKISGVSYGDCAKIKKVA